MTSKETLNEDIIRRTVVVCKEYTNHGEVEEIGDELSQKMIVELIKNLLKLVNLGEGKK